MTIGPLILGLILACGAWVNDDVIPPIDYRVVEPPKDAKLSPFYRKMVKIGDLPVVSSEKVSDFALFEAAGDSACVKVISSPRH